MTEIRNVSDTALWVALYRAAESERPDALFHDPYARRLAGERGAQIFAAIPKRHHHQWAYSMRTFLFDRYIAQEVAAGADTVVNLAAGLDARPYRMSLPASLRWIDVDLPEITEYKEEILRGEKPVCRVERIKLDLADVDARRKVFREIGGKRVVVVSEGLLIYLTDEQVAALADDLAAIPSFQRWVFDLASPALLKMLQKQVGKRLDSAGAPLRFAPAEGPAFFEKHGWRILDFTTSLHAAAEHRRVGLLLRLIAKMSDPKKFVANRPWAATILSGK
jgi:methyltransferase (TIGR00027 family)